MSHLTINNSSRKRSRQSEVRSQRLTPKQEGLGDSHNYVSAEKIPLVLEATNIVIKEETDPSALDITQPLDSKLQDESLIHVTQEN